MFPFLSNLNLNIDGCGRVFHGRGKCFPGFEEVNIDYYDGVLVFILYKEIDFSWWPGVVQEIKLKLNVTSVLVQKRFVRPVEMLLLEGLEVKTILAKEGSNVFELNFSENQNFGLFLDTASIRQSLGTSILVKDKKILNLFSYTCSLSIAALKAGAKSVLNVDMSKNTLVIGERNHKHNNLDPRSVNFLAYDIMKSLNTLNKKGPFDLVICDPPSYQRNFIWKKDYAKILRLIPESEKYLFCLNDPLVSRSEFVEFLQQFQVFEVEAYLPWPSSFIEKDYESKFILGHFRKAHAVT
jgi:23S rRNA (cytosine1962-C5)-methyltransferase